MRALVVGYGRMGRFHARVLADLGYDVVTIDPDPDAGADYRRSFGLAGQFEAIAIATPIQHLAPTAALWARRARRILVEKPMACTAEEARELVCVLSDTEAAVGYVERFNPQVRALRQRLRGADAIAACFTRYNARPSVDVALDLQSHDVDLARFLVLGDGDRGIILNSIAGAAAIRREIDVSVRAHDGSVTVEHADLTAHTTSPLHAQWHAFLSGAPGCASPADALAVLEVLERRTVAGPSALVAAITGEIGGRIGLDRGNA